GSGDGYGSGSGSGDGLKKFCGLPVHLIDGIETVLCAVHGNHAKGFIINRDLTTEKCFVVRGQDKFAHGETLAEALKALQDKIFEDMDTDEKIEAFLKEFKSDVKYTAKSFYEWHHKLTGSCEFGRNSFIKNHGIDLEKGMYTVKEFIEYTKNDFGGEIIRLLEKHYA
ncbi:MAG: hypothetical protein IJD79_00755, partial [Clostridia bacterium]|nr:hypothetical protein [Clostridia bacterium]